MTKENEITTNQNDERREGKQDAHFRGGGSVTCCKCKHENSFWADMWVNISKEGNKWTRTLLKPRESLSDTFKKEIAEDPLEGFGDAPESKGDVPERKGDAPEEDDVPF